MKISAMTQEYRQVEPTIEGAIPKLAKLGFEGIELEAGSGRFSAWDIEQAKRIKECCDSNKMVITNLAPQTDFVNPDEWEVQKDLLNVRELCKMANAIDVDMVRVQVICHALGGFGPMPQVVDQPSTPMLRQWSMGIANLRKAVKIAEDFGVTLGLDNHFFLTVLDHLRIVNEIGSPNLKLFLDVVNAVINNEDPIATARACGKLLIHTHLKDLYRYRGSGRGAAETISAHLGPTGQFETRPPVGQGNVVNWEEYLKTLKEIGYKGFLSIEAAHSDYHLDRWYVAEAGLKYLRELNKKVRL